MTRPIPRGGGSAALAVGRLARLACLPSRLDGLDPLAGVTSARLDRLARPAGDPTAAALESVLEAFAPVPGPIVGDRAGAAGPRIATGVARQSDSARRPDPAMPSSASTRAPDPGDSGRRTVLRAGRTQISGRPGEAPRAFLDASVSPAAPVGQPRPGALGIALSSPAAIGAATRIARPESVAAGALAAAGLRSAATAPSAPGHPDGGRFEAPASSVPSGGATARVGLAETSRSAGRQPLRAAPAAPRSEATRSPRAAEATPVSGLAGLAAWWSERADGVVESAEAAPGEPAPRTTLAQRSGARQASGPVLATGSGAIAADDLSGASLSLRHAIEEILLDEARAAGIEVRP